MMAILYFFNKIRIVFWKKTDGNANPAEMLAWLILGGQNIDDYLFLLGTFLNVYFP